MTELLALLLAFVVGAIVGQLALTAYLALFAGGKP